MNLVMSMKKISVLLLFLLITIYSTEICHADFEIGFSSGAAITFGDGMKKNYFLAFPLVGRIGYRFDGFPLSAALEFNYAISAEGTKSINGHIMVGSVICNYFFFEAESLRSFLIAGVGGGFAVFESTTGSSDSGSGLVQLQFGVGLIYSLTGWLDLVVESRLRVGFPEHPEVATFIQQIGFLIRPF